MNAPSFMSGKENGDEREPFAAFLCDEPSTETLTPIVEQQGWDTSRIHSGGIANAVRSLALSSSPAILVIDLSQSQEPLGDIGALAEVCEPGTIVIALGEQNDVDLYRALLSAGVFDYLVKPASPETLQTAILHAEETLQTDPDPAPEERPASRTVTFIGLRGGTGASTLAVNAAWLMAEELDVKVALLDLDVNFGTSALAFDLEPGRGLTDALDNPGRVDSLFIERAMLKQSDNFSILGAEAPLNEARAPKSSALTHLMEEMREHFSCVMMEIPRHMVAQYPFLLSESQEIVLVTDLSLSAVRDVIRMQGFLHEAAPKAKVTLVANKVGPQSEVTQKDFEQAVEHKIDWVIPYEPKVATTAAKSAKMLAQISTGAKSVGVLRQLAQTLAGIETPPAKAPFWSSLVKSPPKPKKGDKKAAAKKGKEKAKA